MLPDSRPVCKQPSLRSSTDFRTSIVMLGFSDFSCTQWQVFTLGSIVVAISSSACVLHVVSCMSWRISMATSVHVTMFVFRFLVEWTVCVWWSVSEFLIRLWDQLRLPQNQFQQQEEGRADYPLAAELKLWFCLRLPSVNVWVLSDVNWYTAVLA